MNEDYEVIKQIGRGSFSNVYLCKQEIPLFISDSDHHDELFIIKEININKFRFKKQIYSACILVINKCKIHKILT